MRGEALVGKIGEIVDAKLHRGFSSLLDAQLQKFRNSFILHEDFHYKSSHICQQKPDTYSGFNDAKRRHSG